MTINIQYVKMPTSDSMSAYVTKKLDKMAAKYSWVIKADVYFKVENDPKGNKVICEIEVSVPGPRLFAASKEKNYEMAVKHTISDLVKQLKKKKATLKAY